MVKIKSRSQLNDLIDKVKNDIDIQMEEAERAFTEAKAKIEFMMTGNFMTAIDMAGMSITVTKLDDELVKLLKVKTNALAFK